MLHLSQAEAAPISAEDVLQQMRRHLRLAGLAICGNSGSIRLRNRSVTNSAGMALIGKQGDDDDQRSLVETIDLCGAAFLPFAPCPPPTTHKHPPPCDRTTTTPPRP